MRLQGEEEGECRHAETHNSLCVLRAGHDAPDSQDASLLEPTPHAEDCPNPPDRVAKKSISSPRAAVAATATVTRIRKMIRKKWARSGVARTSVRLQGGNAKSCLVVVGVARSRHSKQHHNLQQSWQLQDKVCMQHTERPCIACNAGAETGCPVWLRHFLAI